LDNKFELYLQESSLGGLISIPKSDIHSHAGRGGKIDYISSSAKVTISLPPNKFDSLAHMQRWFSNNVKIHCPGLRGHLKRWEAAFAQALNDNITVLALSFTISEIDFVGGIESFIKILKEYNQQFAPNTKFLPELTFDRACDIEEEFSRLDEILSYGFFRSVDVCCDEFAQSIRNFKKIYRKAKEYSLRLKAHVGEFGSADDVMEAVEELELNEVHHGIAAAESSYIMKWLADHKIQLNICPSSNIMLGIVESYAVHPIRKIYDAGIPVTINTDDLLIFNQTISQEYLNLFNANLMNAEELNKVRETGLKEVSYYVEHT
jgi:adenosine deaminase